MGNVIAAVQQKYLQKLKGFFSTGGKKQDVTMIGLDSAGKTTLLFFMKTGTVQKTIPTIGFNCEELQIQDIKFTVWDIGGQEIFIKFWNNYIKASNGIIFIVDLADSSRYSEASDALWSVLKQSSTHKPLLILANKSDLIETDEELDNAVNNLKEIMLLEKYNGPTKIVNCSVMEAGSKSVESAHTHSQNILSAFQWLGSELKKTPKEL